MDFVDPKSERVGRKMPVVMWRRLISLVEITPCHTNPTAGEVIFCMSWIIKASKWRSQMGSRTNKHTYVQTAIGFLAGWFGQATRLAPVSIVLSRFPLSWHEGYAYERRGKENPSHSSLEILIEAQRKKMEIPNDPMCFPVGAVLRGHPPSGQFPKAVDHLEL